MELSLGREKKGEAKVIPIVVRPCKWEKAPFGALQALPKDAKAVTSWGNRDKAWTNVVEGIEKVAEDIRNRRG
jgi:hypothetical protein